jgi:hypothetical protein
MLEDDSGCHLPREFSGIEKAAIVGDIYHIAGSLRNGFPPNSSLTDQRHHIPPCQSIPLLGIVCPVNGLGVSMDNYPVFIASIFYAKFLLSSYPAEIMAVL